MNSKRSNSFYVKVVKRIADILIGVCALPFLALIVVAVGVAIKLDDGGPIFYKAKRIGKNSKIFDMYKFRSMIVDAPNWTNADGSTYNGTGHREEQRQHNDEGNRTQEINNHAQHCVEGGAWQNAVTTGDNQQNAQRKADSISDEAGAERHVQRFQHAVP